VNYNHANSWLKKDVKTEYQTKNHRLMMKAGLIFQTGAGIYSWLPHGLQALHKLTRLCQRHLKKSYCREVLMPHILSTELLQESGRLNSFGDDMLCMQDRRGHKMYFGPTHEEPIVHVMKSYLNTYKQLPQIVYQIQTKFRDELRPRGGIIRSREFLMLDAYSFHATQVCLNKTYEIMRETFKAIMHDLALDCVISQADSGAIFGEFSEELHVISAIGENTIFISSTGNYVANMETAAYDVKCQPDVAAQGISAYYFTNGTNYVKALFGDLYTPNILKINKLLQQCYQPVAETHVDTLKLMTLHDYSVKTLVESAELVDIRNVVDGDYALDGGMLSSANSIEVGHIFDLGQYYSKKMKLQVTTQDNQQVPVLMGCYGLGLSRLLGVCIEMHSTEEEIRWPSSINPYDLAIIALGKDNDTRAQHLYDLYHLRGDKDVFFSSVGSDASKIKGARILGCPYLLLITDETYALQALTQDQEHVIPHDQLETLIQLLDTLL
jgi:prolyl-tRNA synthetase